MAVSSVTSEQSTPTIRPVTPNAPATAPARDKKVSVGPATVVRLSKQPTPPVAYTSAAVKKTAAAAAQSAAAAAQSAAPAAQPAAARPTTTGSFVATGGNVKVDVLASDSGYDNKLYWSSDNWQTKHYIGVDNQQQTVDLGQIAAGTKVEFGIDNGQGDFFKTGGAAANRDNFDHAKVDKNADGSTTIGFEDLRGGGDRDFNDAVIRVRNEPAATTPATPTKASEAKPATPATVTTKAPAVKPATPAPVATKAPEVKPATPAPVTTKAPEAKPATPAPVATKAPEVKPAAPASVTTKAPEAKAATRAPTSTNRSGLGDGTNPGNGAGTTNSPNTGTNNPNQSVKAAPAAPQVKAAPTPAVAKK